MKHLYIILILLISLASCDDILDKDIDTNLKREDIFSDERFSQGFLNSAYRELIDGFNRLDNAMLACASDEATCSYTGSKIHGFNNGTLSPYYNPEDAVWDNMYAGIRKTNIFFTELNQTIKTSGLFDETKLFSATDTIRYNTYLRMKGEAYFLRAMYHFELARRFETIQLVDKEVTDEEAKNIKQSTFEEAIAFIVNDCDSAARYLQLFNIESPDRKKEDQKYIPASEYGRATKVSAYSLKARALLYLASPLNNPMGEKIRWKDAADAAKVVMDIQKSNGGKLNLMGTYHAIFTTPHNQEIIFAAGAINTNAIELYNNPISYGGKGYTNPTQELVDSYEMINGKFINEDGSGYDANKPYDGRDNRFKFSIGYNGLEFGGEGDTIRTYVGGKDGLNRTSTATKTGYYMRKYIDQNLSLTQNQTRRRAWIFLRYADILLMYAEAMNEYLDTPNSEVYNAINQVRTKHGGFRESALPKDLSQAEMRKRIKNERRVEFAFEEHRFWDVRRWKDGDKYFNKPITGMRITRQDNGTFTYEPFEVEKRVFNEKMNYFPISQTELMKNPKLAQNNWWK